MELTQQEVTLVGELGILTGLQEYQRLALITKSPSINEYEDLRHTASGLVTEVGEIVKLKATLKAYIKEAIEIEKAGLKVELKETSQFTMPKEFKMKLDEDPLLKKAFHALTPGRQRGYLLHFSQAKQSITRESRIEKCKPQILKGKGLND